MDRYEELRKTYLLTEEALSNARDYGDELRNALVLIADNDTTDAQVLKDIAANVLLK